jgi:hypothetical protein
MAERKLSIQGITASWQSGFDLTLKASGVAP